MSSGRILIFDSGVGGLSILQEVQQQHSGCQFSYIADNAYFPYGTKEEGPLVERIIEVLTQAQEKAQADIIIIACNTASTIALPRIRECFSQPVIGVVPAIKPAALMTKTKTIGLLGTPGTIKRQYTDQLINDFAKDCEIIRLGSSELVSLAEKKLQGQKVANTELLSIITSLNNTKLDTVVLACTHFPLLKAELQEVLPHIQHWVDSGDAIARRVGHWINELQLPPQDDSTYPTLKCYLTSHTKDMGLEKALASFNISEIEYLSEQYSKQ